MIPEEKNAGVVRALQEAFGVAEFADIRKMTKGMSSDLVFRIVVKGSPYLMRIMTRIDERMDPGRIFACMSTASEAGLTPRVLYVHADDKISITDFVEEKPLPRDEALVQISTTLRKLHALPRFPKEFNYVAAHNAFVWRFRTASLLPNDEVEEVFTRYEQVCAAYPRLDSDMVSCHMDLKPENILYDGRRIWLVDWQAAFVNDRYFDLGIPANFLIGDDTDELIYLARYFGQRPDEYQRARFFLMRQFLHLFYAAVFLMLGSAGKPINRGEKLPGFRDFHRQLWAGEINLPDNDSRVVYGRVHWEQLLENMWEARFKEALRIVSDRHAGTEGFERLLPLAPSTAR